MFFGDLLRSLSFRDKKGLYASIRCEQLGSHSVSFKLDEFWLPGSLLTNSMEEEKNLP